MTTVSKPQPLPLAQWPKSDVKFVDDTLAKYGEALRTGATGLAKDFEMTGQHSAGVFEIELTPRSLHWLRYHLLIRRADGGLQEPAPDVASGPEATGAELQMADTILSKTGTLWLIEPLNGYLVALRLAAGLSRLPRQAPPDVRRPSQSSTDRGKVQGLWLQTTRREGNELVAFLAPPAAQGRDPLCVVLDLQRKVVTRAFWPTLPWNASRMLTVQEQIALEKNGADGPLPEGGGLAQLLQHNGQIVDLGTKLHVTVSGETWDASFTIDPATGARGATTKGTIQPER